ncbi:Dynein ATPase protein [Dioscorea alata]|uniref:Dynein ATPase protein n=1 Tax=Dioscorea alata TaxID=55571 RepID=A0ACB7VRX7_DIOAL|nr:Dynein ATPase protein [Dioscorea alata]
MFEEKVRVCRTDMPKNIQIHATELAQKALDLHKHSDCYSIARHIKKELDEAHGEAWICVAGGDFGSCVTCLSGSFIFFQAGGLEFLIFKDGKDGHESKEEAVGVKA